MADKDSAAKLRAEAPAVTPAEQREAKAMTARMREHFAAQPKRSIRCLEDQFVQINGYTFIIQKGVRVEVPEQVAEILEEAGRI